MSEALANLLREPDVIKDIENKHFAQNVGSFFEDDHIQSVEKLLTLAETQRDEKLDGDDRQKLIGLGAPKNAFMDGCRYILVEGVNGRVGVESVAQISDDESILLKVTDKERADAARNGRPPIPSLVVQRNELPTTNIATIITGPIDENDLTQGETIWTLHPGLPIRPSQASVGGWQEGQVVSKSEVLSKLGADSFAQVELV